jgi:hypothetical protein
MKGGQRFLITLVLQEDIHISPGALLEGDGKEQIRIEFLTQRVNTSLKNLSCGFVIVFMRV